MEEDIIVTNWEVANKRSKGGITKYIAYIVNAVDYCVYKLIDAREVIIDYQFNILKEVGNTTIGTKFENAYKLEFQED